MPTRLAIHSFLRVLVPLIVLFSISSSTTSAVDLVINEFQAINVATAMDEFGEFDDWVEIHNYGTTPVNVEGMFLTDDLTRPDRFEFPDTLIQPGGYLVVWCDGDPAQGPLHADLNLDGDGEDLGLFDSLFENQAPIDTLTFGPQMTDVSFGRSPNGSGPFTFLGSPTPGAENDPPFNLPPLLLDTAHAPLQPTDSDPVQITVRIIEDFGIADARLYFGDGVDFSFLPMSDDGLNGDGAAGDGVWGGTIAPMPDGPVHYYVSAEDDSGLVSFDPVNAPGTFYTYIVGYQPPALFINEFLASNTTSNSDEAGEFDDWVEIYNGSGSDVSLAGMHLTDNLLEPTRFVFPSVVIPAGGYVIVWCDDDLGQGPLHAPFKLSGSGEEIGLFDTAFHGTIPIDTYSFGSQLTDISEGRETDGGSTWVFFDPPTPGSANNASSDVPESIPPLAEVRLLDNPSEGVSRFQFALPSDQPVRFSIFSVTGRKLASLLESELAAGLYEVSWDGLRPDGSRSAAGVYLYRLKAGSREKTGRFVRLE